MLEAGLRFLESLGPLDQALSTLVRTDPQTNRPTLAIPLPENFSAQRVAGAIEGLLARLTSTR